MELAAKSQWDELYLAFAPVKPSVFSDLDRASIASVLQKGCVALERNDAVLAMSLAETSIKFAERPDAVICLASAATRCGSRFTAIEALQHALLIAPNHPDLNLELGKVLLEDQLNVPALEAFGRIPKGTRAYLLARRLSPKAVHAARAHQSDRNQLRGLDDKQVQAEARASAQSSASSAYTSVAESDGMRSRKNKDFVIRYFNNNRDFGQRAEYESRIVSAMEEARGAVKNHLGIVRNAPLILILYSREEFALHQGEQAARNLAGTYSDNAIRINGAAELTQDTKATLVHEYVHAVVDDFTHRQMGQLPHWLNEGLAEYIRWKYLGLDSAPWMLRTVLRETERSHRLPSLATLSGAQW